MLCLAKLCILLGEMPGKPFRSKLEPFWDRIVKWRRERIAFKDIAQMISTDQERPTPCTRQGVEDYFKRHRYGRKYAPGTEPIVQDATNPQPKSSSSFNVEELKAKARAEAERHNQKRNDTSWEFDPEKL